MKHILKSFILFALVVGVFGCSSSSSSEADLVGVRGALSLVSGSTVSTKDDSSDSTRPGDGVEGRLSFASTIDFSSVGQTVFDSNFSDYSVTNSHEGGPYGFNPINYTDDVDLYYRTHYLGDRTYFEEYFTSSSRADESLYALEFYQYQSAESVGDEGSYTSKVFDASGDLLTSIEDTFTLIESSSSGGVDYEVKVGRSLQVTDVYEGDITYREISTSSSDGGEDDWYIDEYLSSGNITYVDSGVEQFNLFFETSQLFDSREDDGEFTVGELSVDFTISVPRSDKTYEFFTSINESSINWEEFYAESDLYELEDLSTPVARLQLSLINSELSIYMMDSEGNVESTPL